MVDGLSFDSILDSEVLWLERVFEEEEVRKVVSAMNGDKTSGPDGFFYGLFQECWDVLRVDLMKVFSEFHVGGLFEESLNALFIALIPKIPGAIILKISVRSVLWEVSTKSLLRF